MIQRLMLVQGLAARMPRIPRRLLIFIHNWQRTARRYYRWTLYALLAVVLGSGIALSFGMEHMAQEVRRTTAPLLERRIPQLRYLGNFESAVLRYQLASHKYYAQSISRERYQVLESTGRSEMDSNFAFLKEALGDSLRLRDIGAAYRHVVALAPSFEKAMRDDPAEVRRLLLESNQTVMHLRERINALRALTETEVFDGGYRTGRELDGISRQVHLFSLLALLTAAFMIYHVWARFRIEDELEHQAGHDPLTALPHRRSFEKRLHKLPADAHTVVLGTIDRFSRVVGGFGHSFGDEMMKDVAQRIHLVAKRHGGEVFRLDGANFAILYQLTQTSVFFRAAISALQADMRNPFRCGNHEVFFTLSLGCASFPEDGRTPQTLLRNADAALHAARRAGGDMLNRYTQQLNAQADQRLKMEALLRHAIDRGELELYYQPQQALGHGRLIGFEALVRWRRDGLLVSPAEFIPLAEESGLVVAIGDWVLEHACRQIGVWQSGIGQGLVLAVNISPRQFAHPDFLPKLKQLLKRTRIDPSCLELEITETVMMEKAESSIVLLHQLRALGLKLSIDDFGTGYSSLAYLKRFPINKLKIDQSFVRQLETDANDSAIVQATITLGHNLDITVIAEGVENGTQRELLRRWGCDEIQGYYYSRPLTAAAALQFIYSENLRESA
ncbi:putative bifunctional diguanylate cyclase/phosphodiesterase [Janthinobacterium agaricidamnosum]|uniref:Diguanylate cyclase domain protein n=1 Tax=Janthinobacterium agaricidamnosum NBRC 102515 = DSM 9628 TaxID=1349767 RepID=W0V2V1_9BURK|nr:bifunctional diguanylate cyclase/phosphodiesterase [Janthinobacterium agaricidamnosum]CDG83159.1 diguanylate cyclase domain protein [Janthinobacterium agaricidamnosum NBRC 102515 = DSM 9628]